MSEDRFQDRGGWETDPPIPPRPSPLRAVPGEDEWPPPPPRPPERDEVLLAVPLPRPPHPRDFWWAVLWCLGFVVVTQGTGVVAAIVAVLVEAILNPEALRAA